MWLYHAIGYKSFPLYAGMVSKVVRETPCPDLLSPVCRDGFIHRCRRNRNRRFPPVRRDGFIKYYTDFEP